MPNSGRAPDPAIPATFILFLASIQVVLMKSPQGPDMTLHSVAIVLKETKVRVRQLSSLLARKYTLRNSCELS